MTRHAIGDATERLPFLAPPPRRLAGASERWASALWRVYLEASRVIALASASKRGRFAGSPKRPETSSGAVQRSGAILFHGVVNDGAARGRAKPLLAIVEYNGALYVRNLALCRRALTYRQVEGEFLGGISELARQIGLHRSNAHRFFQGRNTSAESTRKILDALHLQFDQVHTPYTDEDAPDHGQR